MDQNKWTVRTARLFEGPLITALALRSKAHWGYDLEFIARCIPDLTVDEDYIAEHRVFVVQSEDEMAGFYSIIKEEDGYYLDNMFISPEYIGTGIGRFMWEHMLGQFKILAVNDFQLVADPFAVGFYLRMGAQVIAEKESTTFPGRKLPLMHYSFLETDHSGRNESLIGKVIGG